jgi:hypothetical protein
MKTISHWGKRIAFSALILTLVLNPVGSWDAIASGTAQSAIANTATDISPAISTQEVTPTLSQSSSNIQLAQLAGQCRAAARTMDIFTEPSVGPTSDIVRTLEPNQRVTLAGEGNAGWIQVSVPASGYVIARYLKPCGNNPIPVKGTCRRVTTSEGLVVRSQPNSSASLLGSVLVGTTVRLTGASNGGSLVGFRVEILANHFLVPSLCVFWMEMS